MYYLLYFNFHLKKYSKCKKVKKATTMVSEVRTPWLQPLQWKKYFDRFRRRCLDDQASLYPTQFSCTFKVDDIQKLDTYFKLIITIFLK